MRPPTLEPEQWLGQNRKTKNALRDKWKLDDPVSFAAQEARRKLYNEMKAKGKIKKIAIAMPVLACKGFLDVPNEQFYDDPIVSWSTTTKLVCTAVLQDFTAPLPKKGAAIQGATTGDLFSNSIYSRIDQTNEKGCRAKLKLGFF